ncbi:MAG TPA: hypothetical protein VGG60_12430 [Candidatus Binataceae bacterium]
MKSLALKELHFLLDADGALIAFQEKDQSWAGALVFSSEELARRFIELSRLEVLEIASLATDDSESIAALIAAMKRRPIRYALLDLDYHSGACKQIDFDGDTFGTATARQFVAEHRHA